MENIFIKKEDLNKWVAKYFEYKDLISIEDLISTIEDLDDEINDLKDKLEDKINDYPSEEHDREIEILDI